MNNGSFANEDVMEEYLSALLTDEPFVKDQVQRESVARLLEKVEPKAPEPVVEIIAEEVMVEEVVDVPPAVEVKAPRVKIPEEKTPEPVSTPASRTISAPIAEILPELELPEKVETSIDSLEILKGGRFQALFFEVAGLTLAVPLIQLGGIHNLEEPSPLFGKPSWFMGIMLHREEKLNTVDTAKWVMPEKYNEKLAESLNYQYLIMLGESRWGLTCETLINTVTLSPDDVKWREERGKRPWLAGMVKEKMCALLDITQLIDMLDKGLTSNEQ
ncbi:chemotaxis protein CheW [Paraneptunicella aestuarii]|uniref:chemotaxis protein CheW n=1 Tax=Paraneptunicella aestuarii TaxID=2831148 RepID=UPI001E2CD71E|nr:chemotaxis protein CheW [Paraneptunicella aestuarii]UAA38146.1 chemotaxis protein CheW [Paraneptunicella aestuarii]